MNKDLHVIQKCFEFCNIKISFMFQLSDIIFHHIFVICPTVAVFKFQFDGGLASLTKVYSWIYKDENQ